MCDRLNEEKIQSIRKKYKHDNAKRAHVQFDSLVGEMSIKR